MNSNFGISKSTGSQGTPNQIDAVNEFALMSSHGQSLYFAIADSHY